MKKLLLKRVKKEGIKVLNGLHVTFYEECYKRNGQGWIGACPLSDRNLSKDARLDFLEIQCDDGFKGNRGTNISFDEIISVSLVAPIGWKDMVIRDVCIC